MHLDIDLTFSVTEIDGHGSAGTPMEGRVAADGQDIELVLSTTNAFGSDPKSLLPVAEALGEHFDRSGLTLSVVGPDGELLRLGAVKAPLWQRVFTKSKHVRLGDRQALMKAGRTVGGGTARPAVVVPPSTPWPPAPTFNRLVRRKVTTTHSSRGAGRPRLVMSRSEGGESRGQVLEFNLVSDKVVIGSDESCDLRLAGLNAVHAEIYHDERDEFIIVRRGPGGGSQSMASGDQSILRTGTRIELGPWRLVYVREEYADHGRPFGGRQGGEYAYQRPQYNPYLDAVEKGS